MSRTHPTVLRELEDGRWEFEDPAGSGKKTIYKTIDEASYNGACKISHYSKEREKSYENRIKRQTA